MQRGERLQNPSVKFIRRTSEYLVKENSLVDNRKTAYISTVQSDSYSGGQYNFGVYLTITVVPEYERMHCRTVRMEGSVTMGYI